jgi:hypothetical protein
MFNIGEFARLGGVSVRALPFIRPDVPAME